MGVGNPDDQIFGSDPKSSPFAGQMDNPLGIARASNPNYAVDLAKAAEEQRLAELGSSAGNIFPDEHTGF